MMFGISDVIPPPNPIPFQTWVASALLVEVLAIIVGTIVLIAFRIEKKKALLASSVSVIVSFFAGMVTRYLLGVI
jgi:hypothetical protein